MTVAGTRPAVGRRAAGDPPPGVPPLMGLVLAGGLSLRMGRDKGSLEFQGASLLDRAVAALRAFTDPVQVSVRRLQADAAPYSRYAPLVDIEGVAGVIPGNCGGFCG